MSSHRLCKECGGLKPAEEFCASSTNRYMCKPCWAWKMKMYRAGNPDYADRNKRQLSAYRRAEVRLREAFPEDFQEIYNQEKKKEGLT